MWHMSDGWGWWMIFGWVWMIVLGALIVWAVLAFAGGDTSRRSSWLGRHEPSALEVLAVRYAHGELTDEQFERMRRQLHAALERETQSDEEKAR